MHDIATSFINLDAITILYLFGVGFVGGHRGAPREGRDFIDPGFSGEARVAGNGHEGARTEARDEDEHIHPADH